MEANQPLSTAQGAGPWAGIDGTPGNLAEDLQLADTVHRLRRVIRTVEPSPDFRRELRSQLTRAAMWNKSAVKVSAPEERAKGMLAGAVLLSVAGAMVYLWRARSPQATRRGSTLRLNNQTAPGGRTGTTS